MKTASQRNPTLIAAAILLALIVAGIWLIFTYVSKERNRDLQSWQTVLGVIADTRTQAVEGWLDTQQGALRELADNAALKLYLTQVTAEGVAPDDPTIAAPAGYLRNLILAAGERSGFAPPPVQAVLGAGVSARSGNGLALLDRSGRVVAATAGFAADPNITAAVTAAVSSGKAPAPEMRLNEANEAVVTFLVPVASMQSAAPPIGVLVGIRQARPELYPLLTRRTSAYRSEETLLVVRSGDSLIYLSPPADGSPPLQKRLAIGTPRLAEAAALGKPGEFLADQLDYKGAAVLATSRALRQAPWVLVEKIDAAEALRESRAHRDFLLTTFLLAGAVLAAALVAAWWYGSSAKQRKTAEQLRHKSEKLEQQAQLLHAISDNSPDFIFLVDERQHFLFANHALAVASGQRPADFPGKTLASVLGGNVAGVLGGLLAQTISEKRTESVLQALEIGWQERILYLTAVPLSYDGRQCVLCAARDMTDIQRSQRKQAALMKSLVHTLMQAVDLHDPHCAQHSERTSQVAVAIGRELRLPPAALDQLELAANLANVGKLFVPREILTKTEALTGEEEKLLRRHVQYAQDILGKLEFDGPVLQIISQKHEHPDGSGYPAGLRGDQMLTEGKILSVANAFVAMISARAYRSGMNVEEVLNQLLEQSQNNRYDRHVVAALFHVAENRGEWVEWAMPAAEVKTS